MLDWLYGRPADRRTASDLYGAVVAQARHPVFYTDYGIPDTPEGRYEMIALHLAVLLERLAAADVADEELRRTLVERFVTDMDDAMRELGIGDMSVPRNVKKAAAGLYQRGLDYRAALTSPDEAALPRALTEHVFGGDESGRADNDIRLLSAYTRRLAHHLSEQAAADLRAARITFPDAAIGGRGA